MNNAKKTVKFAIKTEKVLHLGGKFRKILSVEGLSKESLPKKYTLADGPYVYFDTNSKGVRFLCVCETTYRSIPTDALMEEEEFQRCMVTINNACSRLEEMYLELEELEKTWHGEEEFNFA